MEERLESNIARNCNLGALDVMSTKTLNLPNILDVFWRDQEGFSHISKSSLKMTK